MIKLLGAILIITGTASFGVNSVLRMRGHVKSLGAIAASVEHIKFEICDRLTTIPELMRIMEKEAPKPAGAFFRCVAVKLDELGKKPFYELWREAISECREMQLTEPERQTIEELGMSLGRYDSVEQRVAFEYTGRRLEEYLTRAKRECEMNSKANAFLGVAAGVFAVIILL